jgi:hypothetical protein
MVLLKDVASILDVKNILHVFGKVRLKKMLDILVKFRQYVKINILVTYLSIILQPFNSSKECRQNYTFLLS